MDNQLYRVEIHTAGTPGTAIYKWSRDNGSILTKLVNVDTTVQTAPVITVTNSGQDDERGFASGAWVEISDEEQVLHNKPGVLLEVASVQGDHITLNDPSGSVPTLGNGQTFRRWEGTSTVEIGSAVEPKWLELEDGVQVEFSNGIYVSGDYWTIPARTITGKVEWLQDASGPIFEFRHGIKHSYCPLALLRSTGALTWTATDCRPILPPLTGLHAADVTFDNSVC